MVIDYSATINRFTLLDAYPIPKMNDLVHKIARYSFYSALDMKSAYYQILLHPDEKQMTAFEAEGCLYQFTRMPFGLTNAVSAFQHIIDEFISSNSLTGCFHIWTTLSADRH